MFRVMLCESGIRGGVARVEWVGVAGQLPAGVVFRGLEFEK